MQTTPLNAQVDEQVDEPDAPVSAAFEACAAFSAPGDGSPVCASCGWLDAEHAPAVAVVRSLPRRPENRAIRTPKRLAS
jgi:hypothetical protein